ncbi:MAG: AzlD domain-containing protein [Beijerinckiaceae bacterium]
MDTGFLTSLEHATGGLWPYLVVVIFAFLPTEIWRVLGVVMGKEIKEDSEVFHWVRMVATALVTAVVTKLILVPSGALASVPLWGRAGAIFLGIAVLFATKRSVLWGLIAGELALIAAGFLAS